MPVIFFFEKKLPILIQWNPLEVNTLEVNSLLKSTSCGGPNFFLLCLTLVAYTP